MLNRTHGRDIGRGERGRGGMELSPLLTLQAIDSHSKCFRDVTMQYLEMFGKHFTHTGGTQERREGEALS